MGVLSADRAVRAGLLLASCLIAAPSLGVDWRLSKGISASATFTDNADGVASGEPARAETVLGLLPFITLAATGQRHELVLDGRLELNRFVDEDRATVDPDASVRTRSVLVDRFAELETLARVSQRDANDSPLTDDEFRLGSDREETWELGIRPLLESKLGDRSRIRGEYRFASVRSSDDDRIGSDTHAIASRLGMVVDTRGTVGFVATEGTRVSFEDGASGRTASIGVGIARPLGQKVLGGAAIGRDWVRADDDSEALEDTFWTVALRWEPSERVRATVGYGERVFGRRPSASLLVTGRRSSVELRWSRELSLGNDVGRDDAFSVPFEGDEAAVPLAEQEEGVVEVDDDLLSPFAESASRVRERVDVAYSLNGRRSRLTAAAGWFDDERLESTDSDPLGDGSGDRRGTELVLGFGRTLSSRVDVSSRYRFLTTLTDGAPGRVRSNLLELRVSVRL